MSAECHVHGCDLHGHEFSEGGLHCPICKVEEAARELDRAYRNEIARLCHGWDTTRARQRVRDARARLEGVLDA